MSLNVSSNSNFTTEQLEHKFRDFIVPNYLQSGIGVWTDFTVSLFSLFVFNMVQVKFFFLENKWTCSSWINNCYFSSVKSVDTFLFYKTKKVLFTALKCKWRNCIVWKVQCFVIGNGRTDKNSEVHGWKLLIFDIIWLLDPKKMCIKKSICGYLIVYYTRCNS